MALQLICSTCGRRDLATTDAGPALLGWRVRPGESMCPKCVALDPTNEDDDGVRLDEMGTS